MRSFIVIAGTLAVVCCLGLLVLQSYNRVHDVGCHTQTFQTLQQASESGMISRGWLPDFLPRTAYDIRHKSNPENNTVIASCSFDPAEDLIPLLSQAKELPMSRTSTPRPPAVGKREPWFPDGIAQGRFEEVAREGFKLYQSERKQHVGPHESVAIWHLAINQQAGVCYLWFSLEGP